jgi:arylsulfatase
VLLVSDNGASGEGGPNGSVNENKFFNGIPDDIEENLRYLEELGSPATYNHYPVGWAWAFNTPFKRETQLGCSSRKARVTAANSGETARL